MVFGLKLSLPSKKAAEPPQDDASNRSKANASSKQALTVNEFVARSKRNKQKGLEPTKPELIAYARYLGIDAITDADLIWIAEDSLNAPLPFDWTEHHDSADRVFYFNVVKHSSSWTHPLEQIHRDIYKRIVEFRNGGKSKEEQVADLEKWRQKCDEAEQEAHKELLSWTEHIDEQGKQFFFHRERHQSVWTDPRPAHSHVLYLQMKAFRVVSKHCGRPVTAQAPESLVADIINRPLVGDRGAKKGPGSKGNFLGSEDEGENHVDGGQKRKKKKRKDKHKDEEPSSDDRKDLGGQIDSPRQHQQQQRAPSDSDWPSSRGSPGALPPMSGRKPVGRLCTPPGDGLPSIGRARVRAGIKLEPLKPMS